MEWSVAVIVIAVVIILAILLCEVGRANGFYELLPAGRGPNTHTAKLNAGGRGISSKNFGHRHVVDGYADVGMCQAGVAVSPNHVHDVRPAGR